MKRNCDKCGNPATFHEIAIVKGEKVQKHLCELHAKQEGLAPTVTQTSINELLTNFVKSDSGAASEQDLKCEECGLAYSDFREHTLMGCPACYVAFDAPLGPLLERAHDGASQHVGKVPSRAGSSEQRQQHVLKMRRRLEEAVTAEDYEMAARLRDEIRRTEEAE